ncbi:MAG: cyclic nucleotide-binding domain-containing protein [Planctomycetaceae bacterium]
MATKDVIDRLAQVPIFAGCKNRELQTIAKAVRPIEHERGTVIAGEGEPGAGLFVIDEGECDVTIGGRTVNHLKAGDFFGEMALLDGGPRTATVIATTDVRLLALTEWVFRGLLVEHPSIAIRTLEAMAARLRSATQAAARRPTTV